LSDGYPELKSIPIFFFIFSISLSRVTFAIIDAAATILYFTSALCANVKFVLVVNIAFN